MFYKLSNIAEVNLIERVFNKPFKFPHIHRINLLINGLDEDLLPVITNANSDEIQFAIWGILPEQYKEDWHVFQKTNNTLNIPVESLNTQTLFSLEKRCVMIVTGFFFSYLHNGEIYPFYAYPKSKLPFGLAGIYNTTEDGFVTTGMLLSDMSPKVSQFHNLSTSMPIIIKSSNHENWLNGDYMHILDENLKDFDDLDFQIHPIGKEFYKNEIIFDSFLDPADYKSLVIPF